MQPKKYKPKVDKLFFIICIPTNILLLGVLFLAFLEPLMFFVMVPIFAFCNYFLISPLFGYVELRDDEIFIKYGFFMKKSIPYSKIRGLVRERRWYSESMMSLKNAMEHVIIKYNSFDVTTVSVVDNEDFVREVEDRILSKRDRS